MPEYEKAPTDNLSKEDLLSRLKRSFQVASEAEEDQRRREIEDLRFQVPEYQWDEDSRRQRQGGEIGGQITPSRPMLSISLLSQPQALIRNQAMNAHLGVEVHPVSEKAKKEIAEVKQGLYRRIERDSNAQIARLWALDRAMQCGRGWYRVATQWDEDGDNPFDQEIVIERILNQENVYIDPACQKADYSDARWGMIVDWVPVDTFRDQFPDAQVPANDFEFKSWESSDPHWVVKRGKERAVLVAEYFYKIHDRETIELAGRKRERDVVKVKVAKATAREILEEGDWDVPLIPLIPVQGRELQPFDGELRKEGIVREARDGQKLFNYAASNLVETMALEPKAPWVGAEGQFEGHEEEFLVANVRNMAYLQYKPKSLDGTPLPPPQRSPADTSKMQLALQALNQGKYFVQLTTGVHEASLGELPQDQTAQSGRAILAQQQQSDAGTGGYLQNLAQISMRYEARVVLALMEKVYDRPGRVVQILGGEDEPKEVMLNKPFVPGPDGRPQPIPAGQPPPEGAKAINLNEGKYSISVNVGKSFQTRLQEGQAEIGSVLERNPQLMPLVGPTYFRFRDFPGSQEIADILKKVRDQQFPGLEEEEGGMTLPKAMAMLQQQGQQLQALQQQLQAAVQQIETDQAKQQAQIQTTQMDNQTRQAIAELQENTKQAIAANDAQVKQVLAQMEAQTKILLQQAKSGDSDADRKLKEGLQDDQQAHEVGMATMQAGANLPEREGDQ